MIQPFHTLQCDRPTNSNKHLSLCRLTPILLTRRRFPFPPVPPPTPPQQPCFGLCFYEFVLFVCVVCVHSTREYRPPRGCLVVWPHLGHRGMTVQGLQKAPRSWPEEPGRFSVVTFLNLHCRTRGSGISVVIQAKATVDSRSHSPRTGCMFKGTGENVG